jgi:hypothetical protein
VPACSHCPQWWWSQAVDATLYLRPKRWSGRRWVEDMFEGSTRWPRRSCGTGGGAHSQLNRVAWQLNERALSVRPLATIRRRFQGMDHGPA